MLLRNSKSLTFVSDKTYRASFLILYKYNHRLTLLRLYTSFPIFVVRLDLTHVQTHDVIAYTSVHGHLSSQFRK